MITQFYIIEITRDANGDLAHNVTWAYDADEGQARLKAESAYYALLSTAAVSEYATHAVTLVSDLGVPIMHYCYKHTVDPE